MEYYVFKHNDTFVIEKDFASNRFGSTIVAILSGKIVDKPIAAKVKLEVGSIVALSNGQHIEILKLVHINQSNDIIYDNRLVSDITFATRLQSFLSTTEVCDQISEEELQYLQNVAKKLIDLQIATATSDYELKYLRNNKKLK